MPISANNICRVIKLDTCNDYNDKHCLLLFNPKKKKKIKEPNNAKQQKLYT